MYHTVWFYDSYCMILEEIKLSSENFDVLYRPNIWSSIEPWKTAVSGKKHAENAFLERP